MTARGWCALPWLVASGTPRRRACLRAKCPKETQRQVSHAVISGPWKALQTSWLHNQLPFPLSLSLSYPVLGQMVGAWQPRRRTDRSECPLPSAKTQTSRKPAETVLPRRQPGKGKSDMWRAHSPGWRILSGLVRQQLSGLGVLTCTGLVRLLESAGAPVRGSPTPLVPIERKNV